jgi:hypothetical protein
MASSMDEFNMALADIQSGKYDAVIRTEANKIGLNLTNRHHSEYRCWDKAGIPKAEVDKMYDIIQGRIKMLTQSYVNFKSMVKHADGLSVDDTDTKLNDPKKYEEDYTGDPIEESYADLKKRKEGSYMNLGLLTAKKKKGFPFKKDKDDDKDEDKKDDKKKGKGKFPFWLKFKGKDKKKDKKD